MGRSPKQNAFLHAKKLGQKPMPPKAPAMPALTPAVTEAHVLRGQKTTRAK